MLRTSPPVNKSAAIPRVSVITPTFNRAGLIKETIDSILDQSFQDFEYLIIDDGSTDDTRAVIADYGDRIVYLHHENRGEAASTNRGWAMVRGDYVSIVSSDDPMLPGWLEHAVAFMDQHPDVLVGYPDWKVIDGKSRTLDEITVFEYGFARMAGWLATLPGPGALIRRGAFGGVTMLRDPQYRYASDLESWLRLGLRGPFARIPGQWATWRSHAGSITVAERTLPRAREMLRIVEEFFARPDLPPDIRILHHFARSRAHWIAAWVLEKAHPVRSAWHLERSYAIAPDDPPELPAVLRRYPRPRRADWVRAGLMALGYRRV